MVRPTVLVSKRSDGWHCTVSVGSWRVSRSYDLSLGASEVRQKIRIDAAEQVRDELRATVCSDLHWVADQIEIFERRSPLLSGSRCASIAILALLLGAAIGCAWQRSQIPQGGEVSTVHDSAATKIALMTETEFEEWCRSPRLSTDEGFTVAFNRCAAFRSTAAVCKAIVIGSGDLKHPDGRDKMRFRAARNYLLTIDRPEIHSAIDRDAGRFRGVSSEDFRQQLERIVQE